MPLGYRMLFRLCRRNLTFCNTKYLNHDLSICLKNCHTSFFKPARKFHLSSELNAVVPFNLSDIGEGIREVIVKEWHVTVGDRVSQFEPICDVQSDKATVTITSRFDGVVRALHFNLDEVAHVGAALVDIEVEDESGATFEKVEEVTTTKHSPSATPDQSTPHSLPESPHSYDKALTTPSVRRIAAEHNINLATVVGSGKDGRIMKEDIMRVVDGKTQATLDPTPSVPFKPEPIPIRAVGQDRVVPLSAIQRVMRSTMTVSNSVPQFMLCEELDVTKLVEVRRILRKRIEKEFGIKLTFMPFFIKAVSLALKQFPMLNAHTDENCQQVVYKAAHNIGLAMDTSEGLLVPNIKSVDQLSIMEVAHDLNRLQALGSKNKLEPADLTGGTFTLSNIGSVSGTYTKPLLLPPEVVIGGIGRVQRVPRFDEDDDVVEAHILNVSWSADHRVVDGATMARFSKLWRTFLEEPSAMLLELK